MDQLIKIYRELTSVVRWLIIVLLAPMLCSCFIGPNYRPVPVAIPAQYKEGGKTPKGWKVAKPQDHEDRGPWWQVFNNAELNSLESQLNIGNQNIADAEALYLESIALVAEVRAAAFPVVGALLSATRQKPPASTFNAISGTGTGGAAAASTSSTSTKPTDLKPFSTYIVSLNASWVPDLWGGLRRSMEATRDTAQATAAQADALRLSSQALLAEDYFDLRTLDALQAVLNNIVAADQRLLNLTRFRYKAGTASLADVATAEATLETAQAAAIDNGVNRALFEHAIAVLIGVPASEFSLKPKIIAMNPPKIPEQVPSELLERRPDIAEAERKVASANAEIGVAMATFFPALPLSASTGYQSNNFSLLFTSPQSFWLLGVQLVDTILDGGLRSATVAANRAIYDQTVALYRQTVLTAFQNVEDNLASLRILRVEEPVLRRAVAASRFSNKLTVSNYKAGTVDFTTVLVAQTVTYTAEENEVLVKGRQMTAAVGLITALGGGWDVCALATR
jgi:NodT family efflux transporter outer membrane factor (OMF) lipoprotein